jgi:hypothetical protein
MAKETAAERRARIEKEVAARSEERTRLYFENKAKAEAAAAAQAPQLPASDAYNYNYAFRTDVGSKSTDVSGSLNLIKTPNAYYDSSTNTIVDPATGTRSPAVQSMWSGPTSFQGSSSGTVSQSKTLTPEQIAAKENAEKLAAQLGLSIDPNTGMIIKPPANYVIDPITGKFVPPKTTSTTVVTPTVVTSTPTVTPTPVPAGLDAATQALISSLQAQIASLTASQNQFRADTAAAEALATQQKRQNALTALTDRFSRYGLASLVPKIRELVSTGASEDTIALQLQDTEEYRQRFIANQDRLKKGLAVLDPGTYIGLEDRYRQILRAYGLKQFDNDVYVTQFLANDVSPEELSSRVVTAVQRVQNADPAVSGMLRQFYGIGTTDMVAYVLDPSQQFPKIERQVAAAEIGVAAARQGLTAGVNVAEQLAAQGITQAEAQRGYSTIANILPQATKLSEIYTDVLDQYGQAEAEQEVFNSLASAQRKRQRLAEREIAAFSGQSGLGRGSLGSQIGGQI